MRERQDLQQDTILTQGAFYPGTAKSLNVLKETDGKWTGAPLGIQASRSNSIYGAGSTIRPINRSTRFMIKY